MTAVCALGLQGTAVVRGRGCRDDSSCGLTSEGQVGMDFALVQVFPFWKQNESGAVVLRQLVAGVRGAGDSKWR